MLTFKTALILMKDKLLLTEELRLSNGQKRDTIVKRKELSPELLCLRICLNSPISVKFNIALILMRDKLLLTEELRLSHGLKRATIVKRKVISQKL